MSDHFFVVTGGPGAGKTSLITELARRGFHTIPEAGRAIIRAEMQSGGSALPWADRVSYAERMLQYDLHAHHTAQGLAGPVIFDRAIPDVLGYLKLCGLTPPPRLTTAAKANRYNRRVFWPRTGTRSSRRIPSAGKAAPKPKQPAQSCVKPTPHLDTRSRNFPAPISGNAPISWPGC